MREAKPCGLYPEGLERQGEIQGTERFDQGVLTQAKLRGNSDGFPHFLLLFISA